MKNLQWEVSTRSATIYYKGRGATPQEALADLGKSLSQGVAAATEDLEAQQRRLEAINGYLEVINDTSS